MSFDPNDPFKDLDLTKLRDGSGKAIHTRKCKACGGSGHGRGVTTFNSCGPFVIGPTAICPECNGIGEWPVSDEEHEADVREEAATAGRPSWDSIYMDFADALSRRSTCARTKVGCVVVSMDNTRVLALGYNGGPSGLFNACRSSEPGKCGHLHAEVNALIKANYHDDAEKKVYVTLTPCFNCAVALINAGIREVIYRDEYRDDSGLVLLKEGKVEVRKFPA